MAKRPFPLSKAYTLLGSGPVILISTAHKGRQNVMPMAWHTMMDFEPPLVGLILSDQNYTFGLLRASKECVINIPTAAIAQKVAACGGIHGDKVNKFEKVGLTPRPASVVAAPLIAECYASLECRLFDTTLVNKYGFFVVEIVKAWVDPAVKHPRTLHHLGKDNFMIAGKRVRIRAKIK